MRKNCSIDREKLLKFEAEGRECLRSLEQFIQIVNGQNNYNSNWKTILEFRNMQEKLENYQI